MKKVMARFLIFFIGIPFFTGLVIFLPYRNHLCINILVVLTSALGAIEFQNILKQKNLVIPLRQAAFLGGLCPALITAAVSFNFSILGISAVFMAVISWLILSGIFASVQKQSAFINRTAAGFSLILYPSFFIVWIIPMSLLPNSSILIVLYLLTVFLNDSSAWAVGMLFGNGNRGFIPASPSKSIAGFAAGIFVSLVVGLAGAKLFPLVFVPRFIPLIPAGAFLGLITGIAATLGDLGESVLKRSAGIKDSGFLIPGRGGILDSIDSLTLAAPVYYLVYRLLFRS